MKKQTTNETQKKLAILLTLSSLGGLELNLLKFCKYRVEKLGLQTLLILSKNSMAEKWAIKENLPYILISKPKKYFSFKQVFELKKILTSDPCESIFISTSQDLDLCSWLKSIPFTTLTLNVIFYQQMQIGINKKNFYQNWKFSHVDSWISPLPWLKEELLAKTSLSEKKVTLLPLCLDTQDFLTQFNLGNKEKLKSQYHIPHDTIVIGIVGRIDPGKGQLEVLKSFSRLIHSKNVIPKIKLCIIGSATLHDANAQAYEENIHSLIQNEQLSEVVLKIPHLHNPASIYKLIDVLVVASQKETFGMVTLEGLLAKLIIIGAKSGGTIDLLEQGKLGLLYDIDDNNDLLEKMLYAVQHFDILKNKFKGSDIEKHYDFKRLESFIQTL